MAVFFITEDHIHHIKNAMPLLSKFYNGNPQPLLEYVATAYGVSTKDTKQAVQVLMGTGISGHQNQAMTDVCQNMMDVVNQAVPIEDVDISSSATYQYKICIPEKILLNVSKMFDFYCRIMLGQFSEIYMTLLESIDIRKLDWTLISDLRWSAPFTIVDARNLLIPSCKKLGWNANMGISHPNACIEAKIAYELSKVLETAHFGSRSPAKQYVLRVSGLPLIKRG